jgi:hypothetical protein
LVLMASMRGLRRSTGKELHRSSTSLVGALRSLALLQNFLSLALASRRAFAFLCLSFVSCFFFVFVN